MALQPVLVGGRWQVRGSETASFRAVNPATRAELPDIYPVSDEAVLEEALSAGKEAAQALRSVAPEAIARFLELCAEQVEARADALVEIAHLETAFPKEPRLRSVELPRTTGQLRQAARAARERSFCRATIDTQANIRSMHGPLDGPVAVFGPNNFPFAFNGVMGGDFAAAIAAGNPVLGKANPSHPGTTRLLAEAAFDAVKAAGLPEATVQLIYRIPGELGLKLVSHPLIGATGFTGSRKAGLKLKAAADAAGKPIYLEMSSVNPVFILPGALAERSDEIANELFASCSLGSGQFCTNPGISVVVASDAGEAFASAVQRLFESKPPGTLLGEAGPKDIASSLLTLTESGAAVLTGGREATDAGFAFQNTLLRVTGARFLDRPAALQTEAFGTVHLMIFAKDVGEMVRIADSLDGNLTGCLYSHRGGQDDEACGRVASALRPKVGRLLNDKMPTGVAVSPAMNHGGPFPATGHPVFTAVGIPASIARFTALHCYDGVRPDRLPPELRNENPLGIWRLVDGSWTQGPVPA
jgi:alpha-ketoglutaric semialdehyde dehydrogenase